jgi:hypothetical protein
MTSPTKLLPLLSPPPGGWERLRARRDSSPGNRPTITEIPWLPLVSGSLAATVLMTVFVLNRDDLRMPFSGARLMGERSQGIALQMLDNRPSTPLPSGDPNVRLYWIGPSQPISPD